MPRKPLDVRREQCPTCIFRPENPMYLRPGRLAEIQTYLLKGTVHVCHHGLGSKRKKVACRGGRNFQLQCWHRMGFIADATDEALATARAEMDGAGTHEAPATPGTSVATAGSPRVRTGHHVE